MTGSPGKGAHFVHLRVRTSLSILQATIRPTDIASWAKDNRSPAVGVTDQNNLHGVLETSETLASAGVQPIAGLTLSIADARNRNVLGSLALLAKDEQGYRNLLALSSASWLESAAADQPGVTIDTVAAHSDGLICLTGGRDGPLDRPAAAGRVEEVVSGLASFGESFGDRLYVEIQRYSVSKPQEASLIAAACKLDLPLVATHDCRFLKPSDHHICRTAACIGASARLTDPDAPIVDEESYLKPPDEMVKLFSDLPGACAASIEIARRCCYHPVGRPAMLPRFSPEGVDESDELARQARAGLKSRLAENDAYAGESAYHERLEHELTIISRMGFSGYFLIVADFVQWAQREGIPVGPGRGSGAGSLVSWSLTITALDPLRFGLLFERFLNPERVSMPDFDIDFCHQKRNAVINYVRNKYGADRVAHIITFGTLQARAVLRDVGRVMDVPFMKVDRLAKTIPFIPTKPTTLAQELETRNELREARENDEQIADMIDVSLRLEGQYRNASTHAAGVVIADKPIREIAPLYKDPKSDLAATQFSMKWAEQAGLVKFDFLSLKTLTTIDNTRKFLSRSGVEPGPGFDDFSDRASYDLLATGNGLGVFQMESPGMRDTLRKMKPDCIEDIIALISLYRPGPMKNIDTFIACKHGHKQPDHLHPDLVPLLKETHGVIVYQEQVMEIARILAGYSLGEADLLRRAMGKKLPAEMAQQKSRFLSGAAGRGGRGVSAGKAEYIFDLVAEFAGYGFNKSHAAAYAVLCYQTAYLKARHGPEFMAASMSVDIQNTDKLAQLVAEARQMGITVRIPDATRSATDFTVTDGAIEYALGAIKGVGVHAVAGIVSARDQRAFTDLIDLARRSSSSLTGRKTFEALALAGAFDALEPNRARAFAAAGILSSLAATSRDERHTGQSALFGEEPETAPQILPDTEAWSTKDKIFREAEAIGFFLSGHPLDDAFGPKLNNGEIIAASAVEKGAVRDSGRFPMLGMVQTCIQRTSPSSGETYARLHLSDPSGVFSVYVQSSLLSNVDKALLRRGARLHLSVRFGRGDGSLHAETIRLLSTSDARRFAAAPASRAASPEPTASGPVVIRLAESASLQTVAEALDPTAGARARPVYLDLAIGDGRNVRLRLEGTYECKAEVLSALKTAPGVETVMSPAPEISSPDT